MNNKASLRISPDLSGMSSKQKTKAGGMKNITLVKDQIFKADYELARETMKSSRNHKRETERQINTPVRS